MTAEPDMPGTQSKMPEVGPLGRNLIANVEKLRQERAWSRNRLSAELGRAGRLVPPIGLSRMVKAERRTDVDELVALAQVLKVTPDALLSPSDTVQSAPAEAHPAASAARNLAARIEQLLAASAGQADREALSGYVTRALRRVQVEVEELLEEVGQRATTQ